MECEQVQHLQQRKYNRNYVVWRDVDYVLFADQAHSQTNPVFMSLCGRTCGPNGPLYDENIVYVLTDGTEYGSRGRTRPVLHSIQNTHRANLLSGVVHQIRPPDGGLAARSKSCQTLRFRIIASTRSTHSSCSKQSVLSPITVHHIEWYSQRECG